MKPSEFVVREHVAARRVHRGRLFRKYFLLILALVCGTLIISGGIGLYFAYQENKVALASLQREKAGAAAARIEEFVRQVEQQLAFAALPHLGAEGVAQRNLEFQKVLRIAQAVTDIAYIDERGREQLVVSRLKMNVVGGGEDRSQEPAFKAARAGQTWFGSVYFRKDTEPYITLAIRSREAGPVTVADVNLKFIWDVITRIKIGQKGKAYVVDATGHLVADPDIGLVLRKTNLSHLEQVKAALAPDADDSLAMLARDLAGNSVLTAYAPIEPAREQRAPGNDASTLGWKVFVEQPVSEVFAALDATILRTIALLVAGLLFSALAALSLARSMVRPIATLQVGAARIGAGDLDQKIEVHTGDELETLADQFNEMSAQLRESYAGLERKVEERTAELQQTLEQQTATAEILKVISSSTTDTQPVFEAIVRSGLKLFPEATVSVTLPEDGKITLAAVAGLEPAQAQAWKARFPFPLSREYMHGLAMLERRLIDVPDAQVSADQSIATGISNFLGGGHRAITVMPMLRGDAAIGAISVTRVKPGPLTDKQVALLRTFADQARIAIENVRLFNETKEALEQQTATSDILQVTSKSPTDVKPVFDTILANTLRLCEGSTAVLWTFDGQKLRIGAHLNMTEGAVKHLTENPLEPGDWNPTAQAALERRTIHVLDVFAEPRYRPLVPSGTTNTRPNAGTVLAVPLMRDSELLGVITVWRYEKKLFSEKQLAMVNTFAAQAVIAIGNVRLFNETKEALEQQTATAEVLNVISGSITDASPVFDAISRSVLKLYGARTVGLYVRFGDKIDRVGYALSHKSADDSTQSLWPMPLDDKSLTGRAILGGDLVHIKDVDTEPGLSEQSRAVTRASGVRSVLIAPMQSMGVTTGALSVGRRPRGGFTEREVELLRTFADQAVIAMENVRLFKEIQDKSRQLEIANKHKSDFLANMSHELRTPLNAIIGFSEVLMERMFGEVNAKQADYLKDIHESGRHLLSLINDILDLSKIEAGRMDLELSTFDLPSALSNAMTLVRERAQRHAIALGLEVDPRLGEFRADERKFKQIVLNLLSNAVKFTPDGGRVDVAAKLDTDEVEIAVRDTGIGIAPDDQEAVFEEFKQVGRDYTRKAEGTGLGLALTKRFVELHGGAIRLQSTPGKGSTFTITLPVRQP